MMNNHQLHLKSCTVKENCCHSLSVLDCVTHIEKTLNRERFLNGLDFLSGLVYLTPRIQPNIFDTDELSSKRPRPSTSYQSIKQNKFHMNLRSNSSSEHDGSNSQESLQLSSLEVLNMHNNEKIPKCVITPIDRCLPCADTIKLEFRQHAYKSTPNSIDDDNNGDDIDSFHTVLSKPMNKEPESVYKVHCRKLLVAYQEAMQPLTSISIPTDLEAKLLSLFK